MSISLKCPGCDKGYKVKPEAAGKRFKCKQCRHLIIVPRKAAKEDPNDDFLDALASASDEGERVAVPRPSRSLQDERPKVRKPEYVDSRDEVTTYYAKPSGTEETFLGNLAAVFGRRLMIRASIFAIFCIIGLCGGMLGLHKQKPNRQNHNRARQQLQAKEVVPAPAKVPSQANFQKRRAALKTVLRYQGPSPQDFEELTPPEGIEEISYPSGDLTLKAWIDRRFAKGTSSPAFIFFHGGFGFDETAALTIGEEYAHTGYIFVYPMLRGENGNPGNFELFLGEVDDAKAICEWVAQQPDVDSEKIYAFGHSVGGGISALLSLMEDVPIKHSGSNGGLYHLQTFDDWSDICPFYPEHLEERRVRVLPGNIEDMQRRHYAFIGKEDLGFEPAIVAAEKEMAFEVLPKLIIKRVSGNHHESFDPALKTYIQYTQNPNK